MRETDCRCFKRRCKWYKGLINRVGKPYCLAFQKGIPDDIAFGDNDHLTRDTRQGKGMVFAVGIDQDIVKAVKPYLRRNMERAYLHGRDNLCSIIRDIYIKTDDEEIKFWCRVAMRMSKNMYHSLTRYKKMLVECGVNIGSEGRGDWQISSK